MFRKLITVFCLILMLAVTASWVRSLAVSEAMTWNFANDWALVARHAGGAFTVACQELGVVLAMPHWMALVVLTIWPVFHLNVKLDDGKPVPPKKR